MENEEEKEIKRRADELAKELKPIIQQLNALNDQAVAAYVPLVEDICSRKATEKDVGWLLTWMLDFAGNERMLELYKRVCRAYWQTYPETIVFYIMEYRRWYDPESLIGTEYEYLLDEIGYWDD